MNEDPKRFLQHFPAEHRGAIGDRFYRAVRGLFDPFQDPPAADQATVVAICSAVFRDAKEMLSHTPDGDRGVNWRQVLLWLRDDKPAALDYANYVFARELAPADVQEASREEEERQGKIAYMSRFPPTEKQVAVLRKLGYDGEIESKGHASQLIEELKTW